MKGLVKFFGVMVLAVAMTGFVACGDETPVDDNGTPEQDTVETDTMVEDTNVPDEGEGHDTNVEDTVAPDTCVADCTDKACGDDGCGGSCGECTGEGEWFCNDSFQCEEKVCVPACDGKECGDDGCDGSCGECGEGKVCVELTSTCDDTCVFPDELPTTWGEAGVVNYLHIPANADEKADCFDYTGDGVGDCGLTGLANMANGPLADMMTEGELAIMFEFANVTDFTNTTDFDLQGLMGEPVTVGTLEGDMYVDQASYLEETCKPMIYFAGTDITEGALAAGPGNFTISVPLSPELLLTVHLVDAQIKADLTAGTVGVSATDGFLSGVVTKQELTDIIDSIEAECQKDPVPEAVEDICSYIPTARTAMAMLFDMHQCTNSEVGCPEGSGKYIAKDGEHPADAASLCLQFTLAEANVAGYVPEAL